jgi:acetoin utilization deacetylase AcuC-like enzyme
MGEVIGKLGLPTLVVLEGGYSVDWIGWNTVNFLTGLESA